MIEGVSLDTPDSIFRRRLVELELVLAAGTFAWFEGGREGTSIVGVEVFEDLNHISPSSSICQGWEVYSFQPLRIVQVGESVH